MKCLVFPRLLVVGAAGQNCGFVMPFILFSRLLLTRSTRFGHGSGRIGFLADSHVFGGKSSSYAGNHEMQRSDKLEDGCSCSETHLFRVLACTAIRVGEAQYEYNIWAYGG